MSQSFHILPPARRSRIALRLTAAAALGRFELQRCTRCSAVQYPPREACHRCLAVELQWSLQSGAGRLIAETTLYHSYEPYFRTRLPWRVGLVKLDAGPTVMVHVHQALMRAPTAVTVTARLDRSGQAVLLAWQPGEYTTMNDDSRIREMSCDPRGLNVLVCDGTDAMGRALVQAFVDAGARKLWVGAPSGNQSNAQDCSRVSVVPIDVRSAESVRAAAMVMGDELDIVVSNCRYEGDGSSAAAAREEMEVNYFGLLHLSQYLTPLLQTRPLGAWVNLLSVYALCNQPARSTFSASMAAALSLSQGLRARMRATGQRVVNVFAGPMSPDVLSGSVVGALGNGVEDVYVGDLAQDWLARWLENPKVLEREVAG